MMTGLKRKEENEKLTGAIGQTYEIVLFQSCIGYFHKALLGIPCQLNPYAVKIIHLFYVTDGNPFKLCCLMGKDQLKLFVSDKLETGVAHNLIYNNNLGDGFVQKLFVFGIPVQSSRFDIYFVYHIVFSESQYAHPSGMLY